MIISLSEPQQHLGSMLLDVLSRTDPSAARLSGGPR